jgi:hypothetical protein
VGIYLDWVNGPKLRDVVLVGLTVRKIDKNVILIEQVNANDFDVTRDHFDSDAIK